MRTSADRSAPIVKHMMPDYKMTWQRRILECYVIISFLWYIFAITCIYFYVPIVLCGTYDDPVRGSCVSGLYYADTNSTIQEIKRYREAIHKETIATTLVIISYCSPIFNVYASELVLDYPDNISFSYRGDEFFNVHTASLACLILMFLGSYALIFSPTHVGLIYFMIVLPFQLPTWVKYFFLYTHDANYYESFYTLRAVKMNLFGIRDSAGEVFSDSEPENSFEMELLEETGTNETASLTGVGVEILTVPDNVHPNTADASEHTLEGMLANTYQPPLVYLCEDSLL